MTMQWDELEPIVKVVPRAQAHIRVNKDGRPRLWLFLSETFLNETGHPEACDIAFGQDGDKTMLRLSFKKTGRFAISSLGRGGSRISNIPVKPPIPDGYRETETCEVSEQNKASAFITLPLKAWADQLGKPGPVVAKAPTVLRPVASAATAATGQITNGASQPTKLDVVGYLAKRGVEAKRHSDHFVIDGQIESRASTLTIVNRHRRAAGLDPLGLLEIA